MYQNIIRPIQIVYVYKYLCNESFLYKDGILKDKDLL